MKVLFGTPLRQATGSVESPLKLVGGDWEVPDLSMLCRRQKMLLVAIPYRGSKRLNTFWWTVLDFKLMGGGERNARKHGGPKRRLWRKMDIRIDEETRRYGRSN